MHKQADILVSIGLPTFNGLPYIKKAINSLLKQTYSNFELIISDDLSTDGTYEYCQDVSHKDKRIKLFRQTKNIGFVNNFNFVLSKSRGKYFMWAGDDDYWNRNYISELVTLLKKNNRAVLVMSGFVNFNQNKKELHTQPSFNIPDSYQALINFIKHPDLSYFYGLYLTKLLKNIGGYHQDSRPFFHSSDFLTIIKTLTKGGMVYTNKVLFFKRDTGLYLTRFDILKQNIYSQIIFKKIIRYLFFPLFYIYDLIYSLFYISKTDFNLRQKVILAINLFIGYFKQNLIFYREIIIGLINLLKGLW